MVFYFYYQFFGVFGLYHENLFVLLWIKVKIKALK